MYLVKAVPAAARNNNNNKQPLLKKHLNGETLVPTYMVIILIFLNLIASSKFNVVSLRYFYHWKECKMLFKRLIYAQSNFARHNKHDLRSGLIGFKS